MTKQFRCPSVGVEEEYQLIDMQSGELVPKGMQVLRVAKHSTDADVQPELHLEQIEMASPILNTTEEIGDFIVDIRRKLNAAAERFHAKLVSAGTHPMPLSQPAHVTPVPRYKAMAERFQSLAKELVIFGMHVHFDMPDREVGVGVMNRMRPWLPLLQAITANSPYWSGEDTGYASFRRELWGQWPLAGCPATFENYSEYCQCVNELVSAGAIEDASKIYWDVRLPERLPTIEIRISDALTTVKDVLATVAILRALVMRCENDFLNQRPFTNPRPELLRSGMWQAARYGLSHTLIDFEATQSVPALNHLATLREYIHEPLAELEDVELVHHHCMSLKVNGAPSERQRSYFQQFDQDLGRVVKQLAFDTVFKEGK